MKTLPNEYRAVLHVFNADDTLRMKALPFVDTETHIIDWYAISQIPLDAARSAAVLWAYTLYGGSVRGTNPFACAHEMDARLRRAVVQAIAIRWSIPFDGLNSLNVA